MNIDVVMNDLQIIRTLQSSFYFDINLLENINMYKKHTNSLVLEVTSSTDVEFVKKVLDIYKSVLLVVESEVLQKFSTILQSKNVSFIVKPFTMDEIKIRIKSILSSEDSIEYKNIVLNHTDKCLYIDKTKVTLTAIEYKIISYLIENKGVLLTKQEIFTNIWNERYSQGNVSKLRVAIFRLKQKLKDYNVDKYIEARDRLGYMLQND